MKREKFSSRLGFILISAGCAIGLGNVWRFPYISGKYGGAAFVLIYLFFLAILGLPIMVMEFAVGRASQKSIATSFNVLEKKGSKWHVYRYFGMAGNYLLMMFYTTIGGWMLQYFFKMAKGDFVGLNAEQISRVFGEVSTSKNSMIFWMFVIVVLGFLVCSLGLQNGVEKITKVMMVVLLALMLVLAVRSCTLDGASEGLKFYLLPDFKKLTEYNVTEVVFAAMGQAFFTLSLGIGALAIFGSNIEMLEAQIRRFHPLLAAVGDEKKAQELKIKVADTNCRVVGGMDGLLELAQMEESDILVTAIVGIPNIADIIWSA
jgi:neurotransmitter:Na+ symporter, NSS family